MDSRRYLPVMAFVIVVVLIQIFAGLFNVQFYLTQLTMSAYYVLVVSGAIDP